MAPASKDTRHTLAASDLQEAQDAACGSRLTIDTGAIAANWLTLRDRVGSTVVCAATVKSDAYGCGLAPSVRALSSAGCSTFFVALPQEGATVRREVPGAAIYVLNGLLPGAAGQYAEAMLRPVLGSLAEVEEWAMFCSSRKVPLDAALHVDTGMNRLGVTVEEARRIAADPAMLATFRLSLVMSHLACGATPKDPFNREQLTRLKSLDGLFPGVQRSMANSAGVFLGSDYHLDLVRPGIALYGGEILEGEPLRLRPAVKLEARILQVRHLPAGASVGYGRAQVTSRPTRIAIVATGYGDGYHRRAGSSDVRPGATAWLSGHAVPLFGRISMDLIAVDVTDVPQDLTRRGAYVQLYGPDIDMTQVASAAETIDYELLTGLGRRSLRVYGPLSGTAVQGDR